jgi:hypothetical protein
MDLLSADERAAVSTKIIKAIKYKGQVFHISALNGLGCKDLIAGTHSSGGLQLIDILWTLTPTKALHTLGNRPTRDQNYIVDERAAVSTKIIKAIKYKGQVFHISALNALKIQNPSPHLHWHLQSSQEYLP